MNSIIKIFLVFLIILIFVLAYLQSIIPSNEPNTKIFEINSQTLNEKLYIKKIVTGMTGDHSTILISTNPEINFDQRPSFGEPLEDYIFRGLLPFYYKLVSDTLIIFTQLKVEIPQKFESKIVIKQEQLQNGEIIDFLGEYKKQGFEKVQ